MRAGAGGPTGPPRESGSVWGATGLSSKPGGPRPGEGHDPASLFGIPRVRMPLGPRSPGLRSGHVNAKGKLACPRSCRRVAAWGCPGPRNSRTFVEPGPWPLAPTRLGALPTAYGTGTSDPLSFWVGRWGARGHGWPVAGRGSSPWAQSRLRPCRPRRGEVERVSNSLTSACLTTVCKTGPPFENS